jgi:hypothetical protein
MKLVYGDQVVENASVVIEPSRLCHHDEPGRIKQLIELTVPADVSNGGYAVRQLLGQDPDIGAKSVVTLEVALTQQQIEKLKTITEDELRDIRNGVNPAMIYGVRVYDSEPMDVEEFITGKKWPKWFTPSKTLKDATGSEIICFRRDSENSGHTFCVGGKHYSWHEWKGDGLQLEEITEPEAQAIIAHSVKPTGEYLGCVQWFQHQNPSVIVRRDSHDRCTYFEHDSEPVSGLAWHESFTAWVKSGDWKEITQQEAERRIGQNRMPEEPKAQEPQPGICKREQFAGGGAPSPRNCDVCQEGPCPRVIPVQAEDTDSPAMQALQKLAQQRGIDPAGMASHAIADAIIAANQRIAAETSSLRQTVERSFMQLPADRDMVIKPAAQAATNESEMMEFPVEQVDRPRTGIDQVKPLNDECSWMEAKDLYGWLISEWKTHRQKYKIRCLPGHLPPVRNAADPKPIPPNIPNLAFVGVDWGKGSDIAASVPVAPMSHMLNLHKVLTPGVWLYLTTLDGCLELMIVWDDIELSTELPAVCLSKQTHFKTPIVWREPVLPKDYGKTVWWHEKEALSQPSHQSGRLVGAYENGSGFVIEPHDKEVSCGRTVYRKKRLVFIIDQPTEGF